MIEIDGNAYSLELLKALVEVHEVTGQPLYLYPRTTTMRDTRTWWLDVGSRNGEKFYIVERDGSMREGTEDDEYSVS